MDNIKNFRVTFKHHYLHFFIASAGLYLLYFIYGSITLWELILYYFGSYLPIIDEFVYSTLNYITSEVCRRVVNLFFVGNLRQFISYLHEARENFYTLVLHNIFAYLALWGLWYAFFIFDVPVGLYLLSGILVHLLYDMINDQYDFGHIGKWFWPFRLIVRP